MKIRILKDFEAVGAEFKAGEEYKFEHGQGFVQTEYQQKGRKRWMVTVGDLERGSWEEVK